MEPRKPALQAYPNIFGFPHFLAHRGQTVIFGVFRLGTKGSVDKVTHGSAPGVPGESNAVPMTF
jgi:hypothetical protein